MDGTFFRSGHKAQQKHASTLDLGEGGDEIKRVSVGRYLFSQTPEPVLDFVFQILTYPRFCCLCARVCSHGRACVNISACICARACVRACARACVRAYGCACARGLSVGCWSSAAHALLSMSAGPMAGPLAKNQMRLQHFFTKDVHRSFRT